MNYVAYECPKLKSHCKGWKNAPTIIFPRIQIYSTPSSSSNRKASMYWTVPQGQVHKDWTLLTVLEVFLNDKTDPVRWLKDLIDDYEKSEITFENILSEIPIVGGWLHDALPQFQTFAHQQCLLILGFCPQYGETIAKGGYSKYCTHDYDLLYRCHCWFNSPYVWSRDLPMRP